MLGLELGGLLKKSNVPDQCGLVGWVPTHKAKGLQLDIWSEHMLGLRVRSLGGACTRSSNHLIISKNI